MGLVKIVGYLLFLVLAIVFITIGMVFYLYRPITEGTLYLEHAKGEIEIYREVETSIPHVFAKNELTAVYAEGFLHAQERLWQMERLRRMTQGRLSEVFGAKTIGIDKFFRTIGIHRSAKESAQIMDQDQMNVYQAYADGVNDYISMIDLTKQGATGRLLPPEFYLLQHTNIEPWSPTDSLSIVKLLNFHLSWNWGQDLLREVLETSGLEDLVEEIFPYTAEFSHNLVTILDEDDIKGTMHWSNQTLMDKYSKSKVKKGLAATGKQQEDERILREKEVDERLREAEQRLSREEKEEEQRIKDELKRKAEDEERRINAQKAIDAENEKQLKEKQRIEEELKAEEERKKQVEEQKRKQEEEKKKKEEMLKQEQEKKKQEEELKKAEDEKKRKEEEIKKADELKKLKEEKDKKLKQEEDQKKTIEEQDKKLKQDQELKKLNEEKEQQAKGEQEQKKIKEENQKKLKLEQEKKQKEDEEKKKLEDQKKQEEIQKKQKLEQEKKQKEEDDKKKAEELRIQEETQKKLKLEQEKKQKEEEERKLKLQQEQKKQDEEKLLKSKQEQEQRKLKEENEIKLKQEQQKKKQEEEEAKLKAAEEAKKQNLNKNENKNQEPKQEQMDQQAHIDDNFASNNWVIHGNYTKTGKPLLAGDPHLGNQLPSHWYLMELNYNGSFMIGATHPGIPLFMFGKTEHLAWAVTSALVDLSDLYREKLSTDKSQYFIDNEWKNLKIKEEYIKVKGEDKPVKLQIKSTHRGPLVDLDLLSGADVLFSEGIPSGQKYEGIYSFQWSGDIAQENTVKYLQNALHSKNVKEFFRQIESEEIYASVPQNLVVASSNGDIGYLLGCNIPKRKSSTPYKSCRVLDGTTSDNDWVGYMKPSELPKVINPSKGYIVTANNRQMPDNVITDVGATITSTIRAQRITELIKKGIDTGHKFDYNDMLTIQNDTVDLLARDIVPIIVKLASSVLTDLTPAQMKDADFIIKKLKVWKGDMHETSIGATVYSTWQFKFYKTLFLEYIEEESLRLALLGNYPFIDYFQRMMHTLVNDPENINFNRICKGAYKEYTGKKHCVYNIARAMAETYSYLGENLSPVTSNWEWKNFHVNDYPNVPWSYTPFKTFFHREVPIGGNGNTVKVSKYSLKSVNSQNTFKSNHCPNYKSVVQFSDKSEDEKMLYSFDGGQSGNLLAGHYFDFNQNHLNGHLMEGIVGKAAIEQVSYHKLTIKPTSVKKQEERSESVKRRQDKEKLTEEYEQDEF